MDDKGVLKVAATSALLAAMAAVGVVGWWCIPSQLSALSLYIAFIAYFHLSEFFAISSCTTTINYDSFLLDNGVEYVVAVSVPAVEFAIEWSLYNASKGVRLVRLLGVLMAISGQALRTWTIIHAGPSFTHIPKETITESTHRLVTDGPFQRIRHPAYSGFFMWAVGLQVLLGNPGCVVGYVWVLSEFFGKRIEAEERALLERFGAEYVKYRRRTVSGIPFVE